MTPETCSKPRFEAGRFLITPGVEYLIGQGQLNPSTYVERHLSGDWGDVSEADRRCNEEALRHKERLLSSYRITSTLTLLIVTEWDRSATTLLLPHEY